MAKLFIKQIPIGPMLNFTYLVGGQDCHEAIVIDPAWDAPAILKEAKKANRKIAAVFLTHTHFDHCSAVENIAKTIPVYVHEAEAENIGNVNIRKTSDNQIIEAAGIKIKCVHTPGHTPGSQCFLIDETLFTGDTLFVDGCGRVDLPGSSPSDMKTSLEKIARLPDATEIYPGHDYGDKPSSTIGERFSPFVRGSERG